MNRLRFALLSLLSILVFSSCSLINMHVTKAYEKNVAAGPYDVVIVPGLPFDTLKVNPLFKARMLWAKHLYETGVTKNIIFSGSAVHSPYVEGQIMKMIADSLGIPTQHTFVEAEAQHSTENVEYGYALAQKLGFCKIAVATDPFQNLFLKNFAGRHNVPLPFLSFSIDSMPEYTKQSIPRVNHEDAYVMNFIPLKDREQEF